METPGVSVGATLSPTPARRNRRAVGVGRAGTWILLALVAAGMAGEVAEADDLGLKVPPGFRVTLFSDQDLANDIYAMALDAQGRVVVTSRGYVKTLHDSDGDGKADRATLFAEPETGGMGLYFDGPDLLFCGDGWLSRYRDANGDGRADGPPERLIPLAFGEHGGHAMRKGPDGWWYVIGGNDAGIDRRHASLPSSPIRDPEAGALLRLPPVGKGSEVIAQGFRNPYDFDFNSAGDLFTYDSDVERDNFLPWYTPTRIDHVAYAGHHGWRLNGYLRSWPRRNDFLDTVDILWPVGRGSPTGVVCYRHTQFPAHYRGGLFALDWTFGKVYFIPLDPEGASYRSQGELFLEPTGTFGFAPTDAVVAPDGSLLISIGGRRTRGAVYRVEYVGGDSPSPTSPADPSSLQAILDTPQPLDAWSRARWEPAAKALGRAPFLESLVNDRLTDSARVRAVEILTEHFGGLTPESAEAASRVASPAVRARVAWSLGRRPVEGTGAILARLAQDPHPSVSLHALEPLGDRPELIGPEALSGVLKECLPSPDKRVRQAAARLASRLPAETWSTLWESRSRHPLRSRLTLALAAAWRNPGTTVQEEIIREALAVLGSTTEVELRFEAVRLIELGLGDFHLKDPAIEVVTGYSPAASTGGHEALISDVGSRIRGFFPTGNERLDEEAARTLAMIEDADPALPRKVAGFWTAESNPTRDMHYLVVYSRLKAPPDPELTPRVARALLALDPKLEGQELRIKQSWNDRLAELVGLLCKHDPKLSDALLSSPDFVSPAHVGLALAIPESARPRAARRFLQAARDDSEFAWSGPLIELLATLPAEESRPLFRAQWENYGLRDALLPKLADSPEISDRGDYLWGLESGQPEVVRAALAALERLPRDDAPEHLVAPLRLLRRLLFEPREGELRGRVLGLLARNAGVAFDVKESSTDPLRLKALYRPVFDELTRRHPALSGELGQAAEEDLAAWERRLANVDWEEGRADRGEALFRSRSCETCHAGPRALGPDLSGVAGRLSRPDLFTAIVAPNLDVSPLYRTTQLETKEGQIVSGMVAFESADGLILQTGAATTVRIPTTDIAVRVVGTRSLMPSGLLKDLKDGDLADLFAYLQSLSTRARNQSPGAAR